MKKNNMDRLMEIRNFGYKDLLEDLEKFHFLKEEIKKEYREKIYRKMNYIDEIIEIYKRISKDILSNIQFEYNMIYSEIRELYENHEKELKEIISSDEEEIERLSRINKMMEYHGEMIQIRNGMDGIREDMEGFLRKNPDSDNFDLIEYYIDFIQSDIKEIEDILIKSSDLDNRIEEKLNLENIKFQMEYDYQKIGKEFMRIRDLENQRYIDNDEYILELDDIEDGEIIDIEGIEEERIIGKSKIRLMESIRENLIPLKIFWENHLKIISFSRRDFEEYIISIMDGIDDIEYLWERDSMEIGINQIIELSLEYQKRFPYFDYSLYRESLEYEEIIEYLDRESRLIRMDLEEGRIEKIG